MKIEVTFETMEEVRKFCNDFGSRITPPQQPVTPPQQPVTPPQQPVTPQVPTSQKEYTLDDLSRAAAPLMDAGKQPELLSLLQKYGVRGVFELPKEVYGAFATDLRGLGAKI